MNLQVFHAFMQYSGYLAIKAVSLANIVDKQSRQTAAVGHGGKTTVDRIRVSGKMLTTFISWLPYVLPGTGPKISSEKL
jgi:hypothetical protein